MFCLHSVYRHDASAGISYGPVSVGVYACLSMCLSHAGIWVRGFPRLFTVISEHNCFLLLVFFPVFTLFSCRFCAVD